MRERFDGHCELERHPRRENQVERAVLVIRCKQPVQGKKTREQRPEPKDRWSHARQQAEIGANGEWH